MHFSYLSSKPCIQSDTLTYLSKYLLWMRKMHKIKPNPMFDDRLKFWRQCANAIDIIWGLIYFLTCKNFRWKSRTPCARTFRDLFSQPRNRQNGIGFKKGFYTELVIKQTYTYCSCVPDKNVLTMFLCLDRGRTLAVYGRVRELTDFIQKYINLCSKDERSWNNMRGSN